MNYIMMVRGNCRFLYTAEISQEIDGIVGWLGGNCCFPNTAEISNEGTLFVGRLVGSCCTYGDLRVYISGLYTSHGIHGPLLVEEYSVWMSKINVFYQGWKNKTWFTEF